MDISYSFFGVAHLHSIAFQVASGEVFKMLLHPKIDESDAVDSRSHDAGDES
jgi:hypothetical protein